MTFTSGADLALVAGHGVDTVRVVALDPPRGVLLTIAVDGEDEWAFEVAARSVGRST